MPLDFSIAGGTTAVGYGSVPTLGGIAIPGKGTQSSARPQVLQAWSRGGQLFRNAAALAVANFVA